MLGVRILASLLVLNYKASAQNKLTPLARLSKAAPSALSPDDWAPPTGWPALNSTKVR